VCTVKTTVLYYDIRCIDDALKMLKERRGDWIEFGSKGEKVVTKLDTLEHWGRSLENPIGGWYGLKKGFKPELCIRTLL